MSRTITFDLTLRDQLVTAEADILPPDTSVGIMGWQIDAVLLRDQEGNELDWELTDDEFDILYDAMPDPEEPDYPEPSDE